MTQIQDTLCQLLRKQTKEKPLPCKANKGSASGCCRSLHCPTKKIKYALTELNPTTNTNPSPAKLSLLSGLSEVVSLMLEHECPNLVVVAVCGEVVKVLHNFISSALLEEYKLYGRLYSLVREALPSLKTVLNAQEEYWSTVTDTDRDSTVNTINEARVQLDAVSTLYASREQDYFGSLDTMKQNKAAFRALDAEIQKVFLKTAQGIQVAERQNNVILEDLKEQFSDCWAENVYVDFTPFGSRISRLGGEESDLDVSMSLFSFNEDTGDRNFLPIVIDNRFTAAKSKPSADSKQMLTSTILKTLRRRCSRPKTLFRCREFIPKARIPIVKLVHVGTGVEVDICIENQLGVQNTMLLQAYTRADPRIHALLLAVKVWAKNRCLNQASQGTISTFSWCLLVIYYLHNVVTPTVAPAFQPSVYGANLLRQLHETQSYGTEHCSELIFELLALPTAPPVPIAQRVTTAELLCGFFAFYGIDSPDGFDFEQEEINIRLNQRSRSVGGAGKIEDDDDDDGDDDENDESGDEDDEEQGEVHDGAGISDAEDGGLEVSMTKGPTTRKKSVETHQWRLKVRDPFVDWDLGRCIRSKEAQMFIQEELRRAFMLIYHRLATDSSANSLWTAISERNAELPNGFCTCVRCHVVGHSKLNCPKSKPFKGNDADAANAPPTTPGKGFQRPGPGYDKTKTPFKGGNDKGTTGFKSPAVTAASAVTTPSTGRGNKFDKKVSEAPPSTSKSASKTPKTPKTQQGKPPVPTASSDEPPVVEEPAAAAAHPSPTKGSAVKPPKVPVSEKKIKGKTAQLLADTLMATPEAPVPPPVVPEKKSESTDNKAVKEEKKKAKKVKKTVESATEATVVEVKVSAVVEATVNVSVDASKTEKLNKTPKKQKVTTKGEKTAAAAQSSTGDVDVSAITSSLAALELSTTANASTDAATGASQVKMTRKERRAHLQRDGERLVAAVAEAAANESHPSGTAAAVSTVLAPYTDEALPKREKTSKARRRERREKERAEASAAVGAATSAGEVRDTEA